MVSHLGRINIYFKEFPSDNKNGRAFKNSQTKENTNKQTINYHIRKKHCSVSFKVQ